MKQLALLPILLFAIPLFAEEGGQGGSTGLNGEGNFGAVSPITSPSPGTMPGQLPGIVGSPTASPTELPGVVGSTPFSDMPGVLGPFESPSPRMDDSRSRTSPQAPGSLGGTFATPSATESPPESMGTKSITPTR